MRRHIAIVGAVVTCPYHLPLWVALLGGTTAGVFLAQHRGVVFLLVSFFFLVFVGLVLRADAHRRGSPHVQEPSSGPRELVQHGCSCTETADSTEDLNAVRTR